MKRQSILVLVMTVLLITKISFGDLVSLSVENIGGLPIWGVKVTFDMDDRGAPWPGYEFEVMNLRLAYSAMVEHMILDFDENNPIAPGEIYYSPVIPQLENRVFSVREFNLSGPYVYIGAGQFYDVVVLDQSSTTEYNPVMGGGAGFGATLRFHSVVPVDAGGPYSLDIAAQQPIMLGGSVGGDYSQAAWDLDLDGLFDDAFTLNPLISSNILTSLGFSPGMTWDIGLQVTGLNGAINTSTTQMTLTPVPSAVLLGGIGLTFSGWLLRRRRML